jgi:hypothetical protein
MSLSETKCSADLGTGVICEIWPLPWAVIPAKAGIHPQAIENAATTDWIPAFAGMTWVSKGIAFQMTPLPGPDSGPSIRSCGAGVENRPAKWMKCRDRQWAGTARGTQHRLQGRDLLGG